MTNKYKYRKCPFCKSVEAPELHSDIDKHHFYVFCKGCGGRGSVCAFEEKAIHAWNRRLENLLNEDRLQTLEERMNEITLNEKGYPYPPFYLRSKIADFDRYIQEIHKDIESLQKEGVQHRSAIHLNNISVMEMLKAITKLSAEIAPFSMDLITRQSDLQYEKLEALFLHVNNLTHIVRRLADEFEPVTRQDDQFFHTTKILLEKIIEATEPK